MGGGEVLDTGWHATYRLLALAGERPVAVTAMTERFFLPEFPAEDTGLVLVRFASGAIGEIVTSWAFAPVGDRQFEVMAEHGALAGTGAGVLHQLPGWPQPAERSGEPVHSFTAAVGHFLDVVQRGVPNQASFAAGARALQLTTGAYRSAAEGRTMALPEDPLAPPRPLDA
jgi:predicted dehydrogenase